MELPSEPGVYLFKRQDGRVLYVGKATDIRSRVRSYFAKNPDREMIPILLEESRKLDFIVTNSPTEALVLERELIRSNQPRFNSQLKDGKTYPFIALTSHDKPRIEYTRVPSKKSDFWGPFADAGAAKLIVKSLRRHFGLHDKTDKPPFGFVEGGGEEDYKERVRLAKSVLDGDARILVKRLQSEMDRHSQAMRYEKAGYVRDQIASLKSAMSESVISSRFYHSVDSCGFSSSGDNGCVVILHAKDGIVKGQSQYQIHHRGDVSDSISLVLSEHYSNRKPPKKLLLPSPVGEEMESWLSGQRGSRVEVKVPIRGELKKLRAMADRNAEIHLTRAARNRSMEKESADDGAKLLGLKSLEKIVAFDMSQSIGKQRVGASVVLRDGRPCKEEYRTYKVKGDAKDDLGMMSEVVSRWAKRQTEWPNFVLLDGGETHLSAIRKTLDEMGLLGLFEVGALAKKFETLHLHDREGIVLDRRGRIFVYSRDEAHRFANTYHRLRRKKSGLKNPLEEVPGLGAKKIQALLRHFGGLKGMKFASVKDLTEVKGIGKEMAERIRASLRH